MHRTLLSPVALLLLLSVTPLSEGAPKCLNGVRRCNPRVDHFRSSKPRFPESSTIRGVAYRNTHVDFSILAPPAVFKYRLFACGCGPARGAKPAGRTVLYTQPAGVYLSESRCIGLMETIMPSFRTLRFTGARDYIYNKAVLRRIGAGATKELAFGDYGPLKADARLQLSVIGPYGVSAYRAGRTGKPFLVVGEVGERTALGRAAYMKLFGLVFGNTARAVSRFETVKTRYMAVKKIAKKAASKPSVFFNYPFGAWWAQPGGNQYSASLLADAHARYVFARDGKSVARQLTLAGVARKFKNTEFLVNSAYFPLDNKASIGDFVGSGDAKFRRAVGGLRAVRERNVWSFARRISDNKLATDYFSSAIANPHLLLADYVKLLHPELKLKHKFVYMYRYAAGA